MRSSTSEKVRLAALGSLAVLALLGPVIAREWKVGNVLKIEADVVAFDGKIVKLKAKGGGEGNIFPVSIDKMAPEDQEYLRKTYPNGLVDPNAKKTETKAEKPADKPEETPADEPMPPTETDAVAKATTAARPVTKSAGKSSGPGGMTVEALSLTVTKPQKKLPEGTQQAIPPGTKITLLVTDPKRTISGLDPEKSKIVECIDDKRTNLVRPSTKADPAAPPTTLSLVPGPDGKSGTVEIVEPQVPDAKATRIRIRGELHVTCTSGDQTETVKVPISSILGIGL